MATGNAHFPDNRAIRFGFLISLALHVALLALPPMMRPEYHQRGNTTAPMFVRLVEPSSRLAANPVLLAGPAEPMAPVARPPVKRQPRAEPKPVAPLAPQVVIQSPLAPAISTTLAAQTLDAGTLAQYRLSVLSAARHFKHYPGVAAQNRWQGKVEIRMVIDSSGEISVLDVRTSAGHTVLDQHALEIIAHAKAVAPIPPALLGKEFAVDVPVVFSLRESDA